MKLITSDTSADLEGLDIQGFELDLDSALVAFDENCDVMDVTLKAGEELFDVLDNIDALLANIETYGPTAAVMALADANSGDMCAILGVDELPEITDENREQITTATTEGLTEGAKALGKKIADFFKGLLEKVKQFLAWIWNAISGLGKQVEREIARLKKIKNVKPFTDEKISYPGSDMATDIAKTLAVLEEGGKLISVAISAKTMPNINQIIATYTQLTMRVEPGETKDTTLGQIGIKSVDTMVSILGDVQKMLKAIDGFKKDVKDIQTTLKKGIDEANKLMKKAVDNSDENKTRKEAIKVMQKVTSASTKILMGNAKFARNAAKRALVASRKIKEDEKKD
jgi:histone H3/H4